MRASRLLSILILLQIHGRVSARALAERFEVSRRTIYRDVDELSAAGVPIYAERGAAGGFALLDGWQTRLTGMTGEEAEAILLSSLPSAAADLGFGETAATARLKLFAAMPAQSSEAAQRVADRFHFDPAPWHRRPAPRRDDLRLLARAVWECRRLHLVYDSWTGPKPRTIEPLGIVLKAGEYYFMALRRGQPAIHKLDNARDLVLLDQGFMRPPDFDLAAAWRDAVGKFEAGLRRDVAELRVGPEAMSRLGSLNADMAEPIFAAVPGADGWRHVTVPIESIGFATGQLLGFGATVEVLAPEALRASLKTRAEAIVALYR
ncbi:helix-turn-helix transcriptional regulator [Sphingomonas sp. PR090111-T3T-6A]|uniref:helix-turn-helix transcriptional regulator n=1 Tax=Sphingomonas sp. PR090111-T3T-6A TaxID=685778 RepID=UPI00036D48C2|nr:WYL domain-containing protein [Sphingomonas sp. PR090111-T3T-6A]